MYTCIWFRANNTPAFHIFLSLPLREENCAALSKLGSLKWQKKWEQSMPSRWFTTRIGSCMSSLESRMAQNGYNVVQVLPIHYQVSAPTCTCLTQIIGFKAKTSEHNYYNSLPPSFWPTFFLKLATLSFKNPPLSSVIDSPVFFPLLQCHKHS